MSSDGSIFLKEEGIEVLFVDDDPQVLERAERFVGKSENELNLDTASSPREALDVLDKKSYESVVSGYEMSEMDGMELLREIREELQISVPFIFFAEKSKDKIPLEILNWEGIRYLRKEKRSKENFRALENIILEEVEKNRNRRKKSAKSNLLDSMLKNFSDSLYFKDREGRVLMASESMKEDYRNERSGTIIGKTDFDWIPEEVAKKAREIEKRVMEYEEPISLTERSEAYDGTELYLSTTKAPIYDEEGDVMGIVGLTEDITERKVTGEAVRKSEREKRWILDSISEMIFHQDFDHRVKWLNRAAREKVGWEFESRERRGSKCYEIWPGYEEPCENCPIERALETGEKEEEEIEFPNGRIWRIRGNPARNEEGEVVRIVEIAKDITEQRKAEERESFLQSLLRHDIRNKNQIVRGFLDLIEEMDLPEKGVEYLSRAQRTLQSSLELIEKVSTLRELESENVQGEVEVDEILRDSLDELRSRASEEGIEIRYEEFECSVLGGPLLEELFFNLIENSVQHSDCDVIYVSGEDEGEECLIRIEDDGEGISDEKKEKIFDKGYSSDSSIGSGVGMYLVKRIAESYGGEIEVKDSVRGGVEFDVRLEKAPSTD